MTLRRAAGYTVALALEDYKPFAEDDSGGGEGKAVAWVKKLAEMARNKDRASRLQVWGLVFRVQVDAGGRWVAGSTRCQHASNGRRGCGCMCACAGRARKCVCVLCCV